ncbi:MAG: hypothetical protein KDC53_24035 [Saprospiraceae bacterium]|nr:hypothetical protein [Saprospiraceae bacterium]
MNASEFIENFPAYFQTETFDKPWELTHRLKKLLGDLIATLGNDFITENHIAVHRSAKVERGVTFHGPVVILENCHISANAYFREGVFLDRNVKIGPGSEIKSSFIGSGSAMAHLNYIGNSIIGSGVNFEAGSIAANHYNERLDRRIFIQWNGELIDTGVMKFGSLVGDGCRIGANAVLSPGTILGKNSVVKRLELVEQVKPNDRPLL